MPLLEVEAPPEDSGTLGPVNAPDSLAVTIGFGASLFDHRYGLGRLRPRALTPMPTFAVDDLDPAQSHGDVMLQICANQRDTVVHTVREIMRTVRGAFQLRWTIDGFSSADRGPTPKSNARNLFAFRDGTANPDVTDQALMNRLVWTGSEEPSWAVGGTYQVVRIIRMHVEFWDRVGLREQENMIGRSRNSGAPLGGPTSSRTLATTSTPRAIASRWTPTSAWPIRARRPPPISASCAGATTTHAASTPPASWTRASPSWPTTATLRPNSPPSSAGSTASP